AAARAIREAGARTIVAANKIDRREGSEGEVEAWEVGFDEGFGVSPEDNTRVDDLPAPLAGKVGEAPGRGAPGAGGEAKAGKEIALAVVGRPNVGKSSLVNALLGEERTIVSNVPGTTRDSVDVTLDHGGSRFRLVDTAGIRRKGRTERGPEVLSV